MIEITDRGAEKVREFLDSQQADLSVAGLRVGVRGGGCSGFQYQLAFDEQRDSDRVFESHGLKLLVDGEALQFVRGLDDRLRGEPAGRGLQGRKPQRRGRLRLRLLLPGRRGGAGLSGLSRGSAPPEDPPESRWRSSRRSCAG